MTLDIQLLLWCVVGFIYTAYFVCFVLITRDIMRYEYPPSYHTLPAFDPQKHADRMV